MSASRLILGHLLRAAVLFVDIAWGAALTAIVSVAGYHASTWLG